MLRCRGEWDEGKRLIGRRVFVDGYGEGTVTDFVTKKTLGLIGSSTHLIDFNTGGSGNDPGLVMSVKLQRKGSRGFLWLVWPGETEAARRVANLEKQHDTMSRSSERQQPEQTAGRSWSPPTFAAAVSYSSEHSTAPSTSHASCSLSLSVCLSLSLSLSLSRARARVSILTPPVWKVCAV
eukprot:COSAG03_NODE_1978_length_3268_cov_5.872831_2_plen_180_part_00